MKEHSSVPPTGKPLSANESAKLADLLLQLAGRATGRMLSARRHVTILTEAYPLLDDGRKMIARRRVENLEARWGPLRDPAGLLGNESAPTGLAAAISPVMRVAQWLSKRSLPHRHLRILHRAATYFWSGQTSMTEALWFGFEFEMEDGVRQVGLSSFTEWMAEHRIARRTGERSYGPGELCEWWANEMVPTRAQDSSYAACLLGLVEIDVALRRRRRR